MTAPMDQGDKSAEGSSIVCPMPDPVSRGCTPPWAAIVHLSHGSVRNRPRTSKRRRTV